MAEALLLYVLWHRLASCTAVAGILRCCWRFSLPLQENWMQFRLLCLAEWEWMKGLRSLPSCARVKQGASLPCVAGTRKLSMRGHFYFGAKYWYNDQITWTQTPNILFPLIYLLTQTTKAKVNKLKGSQSLEACIISSQLVQPPSSSSLRQEIITSVNK